ncbi:hypothetical protein DCC62_29345 [candidate division KSB1 bacterium]|nr:MAG: hypothetical protein DCC62_29345 [candidate division KSB1 bacterium]
MKTSRVALFIFFWGSFIIAEALAQPKIYLVRHAEKLAGWFEAGELDRFQPLSAEGIATAERVAAQFKAGEISSATTRTLHTALVISQKVNAPVTVATACADTAEIAAFYADLTKRFKPDQAVVLVSHSNIMPWFLIKAGLTKDCWESLGVLSTFFDPEPRIDGYEHYWAITRLGKTVKACEGFERRKF